MLYTKAVFRSKEPDIEARDTVVEKVIRLPGEEFDIFSRNLMRDWDFIRDNQMDSPLDDAGRRRCLLVVGEGRRDGILVDSSGYDYARYSAFMPNAEDFLTVGQYPALAGLNKKLTDIVDFIAEQAGAGNPEGRGVFDLQHWEGLIGIDLMTNSALLNTVLSMLDERPEIKDWELDKNKIIIHREQESAPFTEVLSDPNVTRLDMYAYGYGWEGMIPLGKERAIELFDKGHEIYMLSSDNSDKRAVFERADFDEHFGMFGVEDPLWNREAPVQQFEVFILNREKHDRGEVSGEWLTLPTDPGILCDLLWRIGIDRPSEGWFAITAVRVPHDCYRDYVTKYDNLNELNLLASYITGLEDFEHEKLRAILTSSIMDIGGGTGALINLIDSDNLDSFIIIAASSPEELGRYYARENDEVPDGVSFEDYGIQMAKEQKGAFTEWGYIFCRHNGLETAYSGYVPEKFVITTKALQSLREKTSKREPVEKPSVVEQIRAAKRTPQAPKKPRSQQINKGGPEL